MSKGSAEELSRAGDQFLGRSYSEMDCQEFIERCLAAIGIRIDLAGSNAWFREMTWTGSPEECLRIFGLIPKGAFLFIHAFDGGEEKRGYHDGKGNASHIGMKTGRGDGAIHSSSSRGCVAQSKFQDKTIRNGGWNMVGLWDKLDYGKSVNWILEHSGSESDPENPDEGGTLVQATVYSENDFPVNMRANKSKQSKLIDRIPPGETVTVLSKGSDWCKIQWKWMTGYMMTEFLVFADDGEPADESGEDPEEQAEIVLRFRTEELRTLLPILDHITKQIVDAIGRG